MSCGSINQSLPIMGNIDLIWPCTDMHGVVYARRNLPRFSSCSAFLIFKKTAHLCINITLMKTDYQTVDEYIATFPEATRTRLAKVRTIIRKKAPQAEEYISYGMPAYKSDGKPLVYFAAFKNHIGFYATPTGHEAFKDELQGYKQGKGSVQFPMDQPLPVDLIKRIVTFRVEENKSAHKKK
jgi:uncharacterized protein YdhG (YjbR/CyaY superfamily)